MYCDGYCPVCQLEGKNINLRINTDDLWECENCNLQFTHPDNFSVVIMKVRGSGKFRKESPLGSDLIVGALFFGSSTEHPVLPDDNCILQSETEILNYVNIQVKKNNIDTVIKHTIKYNSQEIFDLIKKFDWNKLNKIYGCAHSSIIGFLSYEWLSLSKENSVLDGAPSPIIGQEGGRQGQKNSDLLLCKNSQPVIPVEVETQVEKYHSKLESLFEYIKNFNSVEFGILYMTNLTNREKKYKHNWNPIKIEIIKNNYSIALISAEKEKIKFESQNDWSKLLKRNDYSPWEIINIDCWVSDCIRCLEGNIWKKQIDDMQKSNNYPS